MLQPPWLFRRKANPTSSTNVQSKDWAFLFYSADANHRHFNQKFDAYLQAAKFRQKEHFFERPSFVIPSDEAFFSLQLP